MASTNLARGLNTLLYIDVDNDDEYRSLAGLIPSAKPTGRERAKATQEPALDETNEFDDTGGKRFSDIEFSMFYDATDANLDQAIDTAIDNDTEFNFAIKLPYATPQYQFHKIKLISAIPQAIERGAKIKRDCVAIVRSVPTLSATAPTLEA